MYYKPHCLQEALQLLDSERMLLLAGGSDLYPRFKGHLTDAKRILDLSHIEELTKIEKEEERLVIGSMVTHQELQQDESLKDSYPSLCQAASLIGSPQIRSRGTIGGNLAHASPAADLPPVLMALEAEVDISSLKRRRTSLLEDFFIGPGETILGPDELITKILLPPLKENSNLFFHKVGRRKALSISVINMALLVEISSGYLERLRIIVGSAAPTPLRIHLVEEKGEGELLCPSLIEELAHTVSKEIRPIDDLRASASYRKSVAKELVKSSLYSLERGVEYGERDSSDSQ